MDERPPRDDAERRRAEREAAARRGRIAAVFGEVLPDVTRDELDDAPRSNDEDLLRDRPPHHDRG